MRATRIALFVALACIGAAGCTAREAQQTGDSGLPVSGSHDIHLSGSIAQPIGCQQCHNPAFEVTLAGNIATAGGAVGTYTPSNMTCTSVYCHAGGPTIPLGGGTNTAPIWGSSAAVTCTSCHATPGGSVATTWHPDIAPGAECGLCHPGYTSTTVTKATHVDGQVTLTNPAMTSDDPAVACSACHGDPTRVLPASLRAAQGGAQANTLVSIVSAAPPKDRNGGTSTALPGVGAHLGHVYPDTDAAALPMSCSECHVVPTDLVHVGPTATTEATVDFGTRASANGAAPVLVRPAPGSTSFGCAATYCHAGGPQLPISGGSLPVPTWNPPSVLDCGSCHGAPPPDPGHILHASTSGWNFPCSTCHPAGYQSAAVDPVARPYHVNTQLDFNPANADWDPTAVSPSGWIGTAGGCHVSGNTRRYWRPGIAGTSCGS